MRPLNVRLFVIHVHYFRSFHTCRNFEAIRQFAADRWFDARQPGLAIHPEKGVVDWEKSHTEERPYWPYQYIEVD